MTRISTDASYLWPAQRMQVLSASDEDASLDDLVMVPMHGLSAVTVTGADALTFLQSKLTVDVRKWSSTGGGYGYFVDVNGRVLFDVHAALLDIDRVRLWSEPGVAHAMQEFLESYVFAEDVHVRVEDEVAYWLVSAPDNERVASALDVSAEASDAYRQADTYGIYRMMRSVRPAYLLCGDAVSLRARLWDQGARYVHWLDWRAFEIREGFVRTGPDLARGQSIPLEAGADLGVDYNKGCYLGQEVIERLRSRGTPNKEYRRVRWQHGQESPAPIPIVDQRGASVGIVTSACWEADAGWGIASIRRRALADAQVQLHLRDVNGPVVTMTGVVQ